MYGIALYDLHKSIRSGTGRTFHDAVKKKQVPVSVIHQDVAAASSYRPVDSMEKCLSGYTGCGNQFIKNFIPAISKSEQRFAELQHQ